MEIKKIKTAVISSLFPEFINILKDLGLETVAVRPYKNNVVNPEATHADMQMLKIHNNAAALIKENDALNNQVIDELKKHYTEIFFTQTPIQTFKYPECVKLNIAIVGNHAIGNLKYTDNAVLNILNKYKYNMINVKQGYAKCSTAVVSENAIITSDSSIYNAVRGRIDCLKISGGYITLCKKYGGFIGGASFLLDKSTLAFTGDITIHPDYINIKDFCRNYGVSLMSLGKNKLFDVGGVVII